MIDLLLKEEVSWPVGSDLCKHSVLQESITPSYTVSQTDMWKHASPPSYSTHCTVLHEFPSVNPYCMGFLVFVYSPLLLAISFISVVRLVCLLKSVLEFIVVRLFTVCRLFYFIFLVQLGFTSTGQEGTWLCFLGARNALLFLPCQSQ